MTWQLNINSIISQWENMEPPTGREIEIEEMKNLCDIYRIDYWSEDGGPAFKNIEDLEDYIAENFPEDEDEEGE